MKVKVIKKSQITKLKSKNKGKKTLKREGIYITVNE
jgi:hypothetical protein